MGIVVEKRRNGGPSSLFPPNYHHRLILSLSLVVLLTAVSASRSPPDLISDGIQNRNNDVVGWSHLRLPSFLSSSLSSSDSCDETYGFMPCTTTVLGNLFLILVYGYLMYLAATYLSGGSELLLEILGPGIIGGLFLPILGALPDALLILVSGLSGSTTTAQEQVSVGMGLLAGSTVMLLTVVWGSCVIVGKCDLQDSVAIDKTDTKGRCNLFGSGVSTDIWTSYSARIMAISVIPFIIVQLPQTLSSSSARRLAVLIGLILSVALLAAYCLYQIFQPWIQKRRLVYAKHKRVIAGFLKHLKMRALGRLLDDSGRPNEEVLIRLFHAIDSDGDGHLSTSELTAFVIGIQLEEMKSNEDEFVKKILADFDTGRDSKVSFEEFKHGITKWLTDISGANPPSGRANPDTLKYLSDVHNETRREHDLLGANEDDEEDGEDEIENPRKTTIKAVLMLIVGTVIAAIFADPLVDTVDNFSDATGIPTFFISFIALPLATNASESVSAIIFSSRKTRRTASLTFSELYGAATMNNVLCLSVFLALVYVRGLTWDFSSEVLVIVIVCVAMGLLGSFRTAFPVWTSSIAFALYPFSLVLVYVLDYVFGWS